MSITWYSLIGFAFKYLYLRVNTEVNLGFRISPYYISFY